jgi:hypothetical protein
LVPLAKWFIGRADETEGHSLEALRLSPRDKSAHRRAIETNRNYPLAHFFLATALAHLGRMSEARTATEAVLRSIRPSPYGGFVSARLEATIRPFWPSASASTMACARPGCRRDECSPGCTTRDPKPCYIPRQMFQDILRLIAELRPQPPPAPA